MDQLRSVTGGTLGVDGARDSGWGWHRWTAWRSIGRLIATLLPPVGWIVPTARLAPVRVTSRRRGRPYSS